VRLLDSPTGRRYNFENQQPSDPDRLLPQAPIRSR